MQRYEAGKPQLSKKKEAYSDLSYEVGEAILTYYDASDSSVRAKALKAQPLFEEVTEGEYVNLAKNYVFIGSFYKEYILADSSLVVKGATKDTLKDLLASCRDAVSSLQTEKFSGREKMKSIIYEFVLSALGSESTEMNTAGLPKEDITAIVKSIAEDPESSPENISLAKETMEQIERSYNVKKEGGL